MAFPALKKWELWAILWEAKTRGVCKELFTVVNLHNWWSNYPRSIWHVISLVYEKWGNLGASPNSEGLAPHAPSPGETPLERKSYVPFKSLWFRAADHRRQLSEITVVAAGCGHLPLAWRHRASDPRGWPITFAQHVCRGHALVRPVARIASVLNDVAFPGEAPMDAGKDDKPFSLRNPLQWDLIFVISQLLKYLSSLSSLSLGPIIIFITS